MYAELHLHTYYSFLDGASSPEELVTEAKSMGYTHLAITDHDGVYGAFEFAQLCLEHDITPITGAELTLADDSHLTLLAETSTGYGNLCRLITHTQHNEPVKPVALARDVEDWDGVNLGEFSDGLILLTGCREGQMARLIDADDIHGARLVLAQYIAWFGRSNVFVELQQNLVFGDTRRIRRLIRLADEAGVGYVATGNVHYHTVGRHKLQDTMVAIRHRSTLEGSHRERRANSQFHLKRPEAMGWRFRNYPEAIRNSEVIAQRCASYVLPRDLQYAFPNYHTGTGQSADEYLASVVWERFGERYRQEDQVARDRVTDELRLIAKHKLSGFFLIYKHLLEMATDTAATLRGDEPGTSRRFLPPGRGRGSSVSSVVCYLIGLSPVDPLKHDLYVGRFLNDEMHSIPDIDIDFPREIREHLILRVYEEYGHDHAALACTFITYRLRSAVRDVGKVLGIDQADIDRIAKLAEPRSAEALAQELSLIPDFRTRINTPPWNQLVWLTRQLAGMPRHISQHPGGMIISATPLNRIVPIQPAAMAGRYICQWDKDSCEDAGFIKIDFLALGMLSLVEECLDLIDARGGAEFDLSRIDYNDPAVYRMIQTGDTIGVFQIESRAQIQMLRRTLPKNLNDIVVQVAIVRPGPIVGGAVTPYVRRREDPTYAVTYDHPSLEPILKETLGVMLYQEQVVQVAEAFAGFTAGQADQLRRAMTRKRSHEAMQALYEEFIGGALRTHPDVDRNQAHEVFIKLIGFASYGFPKSHAAAFGLLAYQSCWLKHYYPAEFLCALLNNQPMGFYEPHVLVNDAKRHGMRVLRPDVNEGQVDCSVEGSRTVRIGLSFVKGLSQEIAEQIVAERERNGPYRSFVDLIRRVPMPTRMADQLLSSSACDGFGLTRRDMLWQLELIVRPRGFGTKKGKKVRGKQLALDLPTRQDYVALPPSRTWDRMDEEYRVLGLSPHYQPLMLLRPHLPRDIVASIDLHRFQQNQPIRIAGLVVCRQRPETAHGVTFMLLEDEVGLINVVVYPDLYARQRQHVRSTRLLIVEGTVQYVGNNVNVLARNFVPVDRIKLEKALEPVVDPWIVNQEVDPKIIQLDRSANHVNTKDVMLFKAKSHSFR